MVGSGLFANGRSECSSDRISPLVFFEAGVAVVTGTGVVVGSLVTVVVGTGVGACCVGVAVGADCCVGVGAAVGTVVGTGVGVA